MSFIVLLFVPDPFLHLSAKRSFSPDCSNKAVGFQLTPPRIPGLPWGKLLKADKLCLGPSVIFLFGAFFLLMVSLGTAVPIPVSGNLDPSWLGQTELVRNKLVLEIR